MTLLFAMWAVIATVLVPVALWTGAAHAAGIEDADRWLRLQRDTFGARAQEKRRLVRRQTALRAARLTKIVRTAVAMAALATGGRVLDLRRQSQRIAGSAPWPGHEPAEPPGAPEFHTFMDGLMREDRP